MATRDRKPDPRVVTLAEWRRAATERFRADGFESPTAEADALAGHVLRVSRSELVINPKRHLSSPESRRLSVLLQRRLDHVPLQYLLGKVDFAGNWLRVRRGVFIPRPETEGLVDRVLDAFEPDARGTILDGGTGTGAIAVSLALGRPGMTVLATDLSRRAVGLARINVRALGLADRVQVLEGDLLDPIARTIPLKAVVSNPPYIARRDRDMLDPEVIEHEPHLALFAEDDGMAVIRRLVDEAAPRLEDGGLLALEIGDHQGRQVNSLLAGSGDWTRIRIEQDLAGKDRYALALRAR